ncbi:MAG: hypothetical protein IJT61_02375 [Bacteroidales bacterium]|nr:hypothetical protein [Bacteroidales bacterium]
MSTQVTYTLSDTAKCNIAKDLRLASFSEVMDMDALSLDRHIERQIKKRLRLSAVFGNLIGRGSLYTYFNRLLTREWIDQQLSKIS